MPPSVLRKQIAIYEQLVPIFESGDLDSFIALVESEALAVTCHDDGQFPLFHLNETKHSRRFLIVSGTTEKQHTARSVLH